MFDEEPDGDAHGECLVEIRRLQAQNEDLRAALQELCDRCVLVKAALDEGIVIGEPVHPQSAALTWPLATAIGALKRAAPTRTTLDTRSADANHLNDCRW